MARRPEPWKRKGIKGGPWYAWVNGRQEWLAPGRAKKSEAQAVLDDLIAANRRAERRPGGGFTARDVVNLFLSYARAAGEAGELDPVTVKGYERFLTPFAAEQGRVPVASLKPAAVELWLRGKATWGPTTRNNAVTAVKRAFRWAKKSGHIPADPLADAEKPTAKRRETSLAPGQAEAIIAAARDQAFRDYLTALCETGCRPGEVQTLTADRADVAARTWTVTNKTRRKTGERFRTVYLSDAALALTTRLLGRHPEGPLFRNARGNAWTRHAVAHRLGRIADRLGMGPEAVAYSLRHHYITDCLERGIPPATVAELVGHKSLKMIMSVYSKLGSRTQHLRDAARAARPGPASGTGSAPGAP